VMNLHHKGERLQMLLNEPITSLANLFLVVSFSITKKNSRKKPFGSIFINFPYVFYDFFFC